MRASHCRVITHREDPMSCLLRRCAYAVTVLCASGSLAVAQDVPYSQRVQFEAPPVALDSNSVQLSVVHFGTRMPVRALVCFDSPQVMTVITDETGAARVSNLTQTNTHVRVLAPGFAEISLIFFPGKLGRSFARVRLIPDANTASTNPSCDTGRRTGLPDSGDFK
jgi:hypothetical protein